jgi:hypothetical protein
MATVVVKSSVTSVELRAARREGGCIPFTVAGKECPARIVTLTPFNPGRFDLEVEIKVDDKWCDGSGFFNTESHEGVLTY